MKNIYFTGDTHFSHKNILKYANRPFSSVEEMDDLLIQNWNNYVKPGDDIYHLGDFAFCHPEKAQKIADRLNGNIMLIRGNHDKDVTKVKRWSWIRDMYQFNVGRQSIVLCHYAMTVWNKVHHGAIQLYGHSHGALQGNSQQTDVGVDCWDYRPTHLDEILERMNNSPKRIPVDHHQ